jgi:opacity protein-like surface antigen
VGTGHIMKIYLSLLVGAILAARIGVPAAWAADPAMTESTSDLGLYLAVAGGWTHADSDQSPTFDGEVFFKNGWIGSAALGVHFTDHVRAEFEWAAHQNSLDHISSGAFSMDINGDLTVFTGLAKIAYDFGNGPLRPYVAVGGGLANFEVTVKPPTGSGSDSEMAVAGTLEAGINYAMTANAEIFSGVQVLMLDDVTIDPDSSGATELSNPLFVSAAVGLRWNF